MLDAGSSAAHARSFLDGVRELGVEPPRLVALTHSHWDHVFGAAELDALVVTHVGTAAYLADAAKLDWSDEALEQRLTAGEVTQFHVDNVRQELPAPRDVRIARADIVFRDSLTFDLGDVTVRVRHEENDHTDDGSVMFVDPDRVLFVGDALCDSPDGRLTTGLVFPLLDALLAFGAEHVVEGHNETVMSRTEFEELAGKLRQAGKLVGRVGPDEGVILAELGGRAEDDTGDIVRAFVRGRAQENPG